MNNPIARLGVCAAFALAVSVAMVAEAAAQFHACYVQKTGVIYRIDPTGTLPGDLPTECAKPNKHIEFSWVDAAGADHGKLGGLGDDDHQQYLLADGTRALSGDFAAGGNKITGLAEAATAGDAVPYEQAVKNGDAAGGDLAGAYPNPTVAKLQTKPVSAAVPTDGDVLMWDGLAGAWTPATLGGGLGLETVRGHEGRTWHANGINWSEDTATCPEGKSPIAGGHDLDIWGTGTTILQDFIIKGNHPWGRSWVVEVGVPGSPDLVDNFQINAWAVCANE